MPTRIRRKMRAQLGGSMIPKHKEESIRKLAEDTEDLGLQILEIQKQISDNMTEMAQHMKAYSVAGLAALYGDYVMETPKGRSSTVVSVPELQARVSEEEFIECVSASVTKVRKILSEKEVADISETTPGKLGSPRVTYKPKKK